MKQLNKRNYKTFHFQSTLPKLPVPELNNTVNKYLKTLVPIIPKNEYEQSVKYAEDFIKPNGIGHKLHNELLKHAEKHQSTSWLHDWWNSYAYMSYRESVVNNVSFCYGFEDPGRKYSQIERAANLTSYLLAIKKSIEDQTFPPDIIRDVPQCMNAYNNLFSTCRIPAPNNDVSYHATSPKDSSHIIVMRNNKFFSVNVHADDGTPLHRDQIEELLREVVEKADQVKNTPNIGILTAEHRDTWTKIREKMIQSDINRKSLKTIENAGFILNLDSLSPRNENEFMLLLLNGISSSKSSSNRFYDKTLNIVVFENSQSGLVGEHSIIDGYPVTVITDIMLKQEREGVLLDGKRVDRLPKPILLEWEINESLEKDIQNASKYNDSNCSKIDLNVLRYTNYGKSEIKKFKLSPDGYLQMAFHLAYYRLHKKFAPTYESCSTRKYAYGRTETGRTLSMDAVNFVLSMEDPSVPENKRHELLSIACKSHINYIKEASEGYGCDRHILGLKLIAKEQGIEHPFLSDTSQSKSSHWILSTSQLPSTYSLTGYGPVVPDGYGLFYNIRNDSLNFVITNLKNESQTDCFKFSQSLSKSLDDIYSLCAANIRSNL